MQQLTTIFTMPRETGQKKFLTPESMGEEETLFGKKETGSIDGMEEAAYPPLRESYFLMPKSHISHAYYTFSTTRNVHKQFSNC